MIALDLFLALEVAFHSRRRDAPERLLSVEFFELIPCCAAQFARPDGRERQQTERQSRHRARKILFGGDDHLLEWRELGDCWLASLAQRLQHGTQLLGW